MKIPALTTDQMREVDRLMTEVYGISLLQMMENAGRNLGKMARRMLNLSLKGKSIIVMVGPGNNGGGGMVAARYMHHWGANVRLKLALEPALLKEVPAHQWAILQQIGLDRQNPEIIHPDLIVDALLGYGISSNPHFPISAMIHWANSQVAPILALDTPSGLDTTTGIAYTPAVHATTTLTLALPKAGLLSPSAGEYVGKLFLADIGVPEELYARLGLTVSPIFTRGEILRVK